MGAFKTRRYGKIFVVEVKNGTCITNVRVQREYATGTNPPKSMSSKHEQRYGNVLFKR